MRKLELPPYHLLPGMLSGFSVQRIASSVRAMIVIPTYNEILTIEELCEAILRVHPRLDVVIVDDNSPDGTGNSADILAAGNNRIKVVHRPTKLGLGSAYASGFRIAKELGYGIVGSLDADFSHDPAVLSAMLGEIDRGADVVIGSRYVSGGAIVNWKFSRKLNSWVANTLIRTVLGLKPHDCTSGFRLYRASIFRKFPEETILSKGFDALVEILFRAQVAGMVIAEVPITFRDRSSGQSKFGVREIKSSLRTIARLGFERATSIINFSRRNPNK